MATYHIRQCNEAQCRFRYPMPEDNRSGLLCPKCGANTTQIEITRTNTALNQKPDGLPHVEVLLDNIRSVYNVGSLFRTADGVGAHHIHLCGITATPENPQLTKTALGADSTLGWTQHLNGPDAVRMLKEKGYQLIAIEDTPKAISLFDFSLKPSQTSLVLIVGNEKIGVDPEILELCDQILRIPMYGIKDSLNVAVAFGIALYQITFQISPAEPLPEDISEIYTSLSDLS